LAVVQEEVRVGLVLLEVLVVAMDISILVLAEQEPLVKEMLVAVAQQLYLCPAVVAVAQVKLEILEVKV
jgi:hypothetical protein